MTTSTPRRMEDAIILAFSLSAIVLIAIEISKLPSGNAASLKIERSGQIIMRTNTTTAKNDGILLITVRFMISPFAQLVDSCRRF